MAHEKKLEITEQDKVIVNKVMTVQDIKQEFLKGAGTAVFTPLSKTPILMTPYARGLKEVSALVILEEVYPCKVTGSMMKVY